MQTLSKRLSAIASLINKGDRVADIGTDHGLLPIFLRQSGTSPFVLACDIGEKPLESAVNNVKKSGLDNIAFRLCDGLDGVGENEVDTVVIAGMGGECIAGILKRCGWAKNSGKRFILQPMNSPEELRAFLLDGYTLRREEAVLDGGRAYTVLEIVALPDTVKRDGGFVFCGLLDPKKEADRAYLLKQYERLNGCAEDIKDIAETKERFDFFRFGADSVKRILEI